MSETVSVTFVFALGQRVRWDEGDKETVYTIRWREWHQGRASTWVQYGLALDAEGPVEASAYEVDLDAVEDEA